MDILKQQLKIAKVTYPFICKPILGHGSRKAHEMLIIFNEKSLVDCRTPCVAQSFINHNAVLFKIFILACDSETIYFDSSDVSKADSKSRLSVLDPEDVLNVRVHPDERILDIIAHTLRKAFGMELLGVDVVIEKSTGKYAIIDVNAYPVFPENNYVSTAADIVDNCNIAEKLKCGDYIVNMETEHLKEFVAKMNSPE
ncbi:hypothetical protein NQ317_002549 [Molorchus minor]|uniref:inositol-1,3,4-trisphosphate 5/6-kinase n=1 Tax=Molorchus minor TaxID=1323400 RepID=A0ABQ9JRI1_9CUCU|nr:hypothetical protein NQ317_002549 [Molorchus minor]